MSYPCRLNNRAPALQSSPAAQPWRTCAPRRGRCCRAGPDGPLSRREHNDIQSQSFEDPSVVQQFCEPLPAEITERLQQIVDAAPGLGPSSRVVDVGTGTGCLLPYMQARGVRDILAVDLSAAMLGQLQQTYRNPGVLGNDLGVRTWQGDFVDLPAFQGPVDAVFMNAVLGNVHDQREALLRAALLLRPGGSLVLSHPLGRTWHKELRAGNPQMVPHELPTSAALHELTEDLPLQVMSFRDEPELYLAALQVPPLYALPDALRLSGPVITGFGRGSKQLGVPTANLDPVPLQAVLKGLPRGVYFGWAQLDPPEGWPREHGAIHKAVINIGSRPTVNDGSEADTVEAHVMHAFPGDFYGSTLRVLALGYLRPEIKFKGLPQLLARIRADVGIAKAMLDVEELQQCRHDSLFTAL